VKPDQQTEYIVQALRVEGAMYEEDARNFLAEHDAHVRAEALTEAADYFEQRRPSRAEADTHFQRGRRATVGWVVEELREKAGKKATADAATVTPDFFEPGRAYTSADRYKLTVRFVCEHLTTDPQNGRREAWGWLHRANGSRCMQRLWADDWPTWTEAGDQ